MRRIGGAGTVGELTAWIVSRPGDVRLPGGAMQECGRFAGWPSDGMEREMAWMTKSKA